MNELKLTWLDLPASKSCKGCGVEMHPNRASEYARPSRWRDRRYCTAGCHGRNADRAYEALLARLREEAAA